jgi:hypothetical protein
MTISARTANGLSLLCFLYFYRPPSASTLYRHTRFMRPRLEQLPAPEFRYATPRASHDARLRSRRRVQRYLEQAGRIGSKRAGHCEPTRRVVPGRAMQARRCDCPRYTPLITARWRRQGPSSTWEIARPVDGARLGGDAVQCRDDYLLQAARMPRLHAPLDCVGAASQCAVEVGDGHRLW